jgi:endonuclease V-like protein UPF0215 family
VERDYVVDCLVMLDGINGGFFSYMDYDQAYAIQEFGGLQKAEQVILKETPDRKIPDTLKNGLVEITDVLVRLQPNCAFYLN